MKPATHRNDPITSFMAETYVNDSGIRSAQRKHVLSLLRQHPGSTSAELAEKTGEDRAMIARRLNELIPDYAVRGVIVKCRAKGTKAVTWWPI